MSTKTVLITSAVVLGLFAIYNERQKKNSSPTIYFIKKMQGNYNGRCVPPFGIFIHESQRNNQNLINHELVHWQQYQRLGLLKFYSEFNKQIKQYGYDLAPLEIEARYAENDYCRYNYTECVRNGQAVTVHNPQFLK